MKLIEALQVASEAKTRPPRDYVFLVCGFEPLHLTTFLQAHYAERFADRSLKVSTGLYGDLVGNAMRAADEADETTTGMALVLEWGNLDPRLGVRSVGPWGGAKEADVLSDVGEKLSRLRDAVDRISARFPIAICPPTLPLLLGGQTRPVQDNPFELTLRSAMSSFLRDLANDAHVSIVSQDQLAISSAVSLRHDIRSELGTGFPYRLPHASTLADSLLTLLFPPEPKKALITDLDDTLWRGLVGEVGAQGVGWAQDQGAQVHGLYQSLLQQLFEMGVLIGVATKNDPESVEAALRRDDLLLDPKAPFPICASWGDKSLGIARCLKTWNISATDTVFVDDSPLELDLARRAFPALTCLRFDPLDPPSVMQLLVRLRSLFGRRLVTEDDRSRAASVRAGAAFEATRSVGVDGASFLRELKGELAFARDTSVDPVRGLQLLNKTNQFNLNGLRLNETEWRGYLAGGERFVLSVDYRDRYGPLGTVGVATGTRGAECLVIEHWVLSCRAFSRNIEHHMLQALLELAEGRELEFEYVQTARNAPVRRFFESIALAPTNQETFRLSQTQVAAALDGGLPHELRST
jgi:FkbH-like protein